MSLTNILNLAPKKDEIWTPATVHLVDKICPKCALGRMTATGRIAQPAPNVPPVFEHKCDKCLHKEAYGKQYPRAEFTKIEEKGVEETQ